MKTLLNTLAIQYAKTGVNNCNKESVKPFLVKDVKPLLAEIIKTIEAKRTKRMSYKVIPKVKHFCDNLIKIRLNEIASALPCSGHSMGEYKKVIFNKLEGNDNRLDTYAKSCTYNPTYGYVAIKLTGNELRHTYVIGGLLTIKGKKVKKDCYAVKTLQGIGSKQHLKLIWKDCYLYQNYHFDHISEYEQVKQRLKDKEKAILETKRKAKLFAKLRTKALELFYGIEHSYQAGNCKAGTENFIKNAGIDLNKIGGVRGDILVELGVKTNTIGFVERIITLGVNRIK